MSGGSCHCSVLQLAGPARIGTIPMRESTLDALVPQGARRYNSFRNANRLGFLQ